MHCYLKRLKVFTDKACSQLKKVQQGHSENNVMKTSMNPIERNSLKTKFGI